MPNDERRIGVTSRRGCHSSFGIRHSFVIRYSSLVICRRATDSGGVRVVNEDVVRELGIPKSLFDAVAAEELQELERRERAYRDDRPAPDVRGKTVILVDDGLATGSSMRAAVAALRRLDPTRIVVAVPVGAPETCEEFEGEADEAICAREPDPFYAVGMWYEDFSQPPTRK